MFRTLLAFACLLGFAATVHAQDDSGFVDLFNGKDLSGWTQRNGTATYKVDGDAILGTTSEGSRIPSCAPTRFTATLN